MALVLAPERDSLLTDFGKTTLKKQYCLPGEGYQNAFARAGIPLVDEGVAVGERQQAHRGPVEPRGYYTSQFRGQLHRLMDRFLMKERTVSLS